MKVAAADPVRLLQSLEAARCAPLTSNPMSGSATAVQLSQSVALIERFVVDQLPQGRTGDNLLAAWNCVVAHSVRAAPLGRDARPRVAEQLRCKAEMASTSHGSRVMVFRADNSSSELAIVARIEELLAPVQPLEQALFRARAQKRLRHVRDFYGLRCSMLSMGIHPTAHHPDLSFPFQSRCQLGVKARPSARWQIPYTPSRRSSRTTGTSRS